MQTHAAKVMQMHVKSTTAPPSHTHFLPVILPPSPYIPEWPNFMAVFLWLSVCVSCSQAVRLIQCPSPEKSNARS